MRVRMIYQCEPMVMSQHELVSFCQKVMGDRKSKDILNVTVFDVNHQSYSRVLEPNNLVVFMEDVRSLMDILNATDPVLKDMNAVEYAIISFISDNDQPDEPSMTQIDSSDPDNPVIREIKLKFDNDTRSFVSTDGITKAIDTIMDDYTSTMKGKYFSINESANGALLDFQLKKGLPIDTSVRDALNSLYDYEMENARYVRMLAHDLDTVVSLLCKLHLPLVKKFDSIDEIMDDFEERLDERINSMEDNMENIIDLIKDNLDEPIKHDPSDPEDELTPEEDPTNDPEDEEDDVEDPDEDGEDIED